MALMNKLFNRQKRKHNANPQDYQQNGQYLSDLPQQTGSVFDDYLFGDSLLPGTHAIVAEYTIDPKLTDLYVEIDKGLDEVFKRGSIDEYNVDMFDNRIVTARANALRSVEHQYADTPQKIQIAVSKRQADKTRLEMGEVLIYKELDDRRKELETLQEREAVLYHIINKRGAKK